MLGFIAFAECNHPPSATRVKLAARAGQEWAMGYLGKGWVGAERTRLEAAAGAVAAELQIIVELAAKSHYGKLHGCGL